MKLSTQKNICFFGVLLLGITSVGLILHGLFGPIQIVSDDHVTIQSVRDVPHSDSEIEFSVFASVWNHPLQSPVFDAVPDEEVKPEPPAIKAMLMATVQEAGEWKAMLKLPSGAIAILSKGDHFENESRKVTILDVGEKNVVVGVEGFDDSTITLDLGR